MMDLAFFEGMADFIQKVKPKDGATKIEADLYYMVCNDEMCLPPTGVDFVIDLASGKGGVKTLVTEGNNTVNEEFILPGVDLDNPYSECSTDEEQETDQNESSSLLKIFLLGFGGGLVALFTPCVFPMIPLTVSFFTKGSGDRKQGLFRAILYGFFIFAIYFAISIPFHIWKIDPAVFSVIATGVGMNLFFFIIFVVFAISFFGYFEIQLPQSWANKADKASNTGGLIGMFFMALTLVVVSFSCTGPILGSVLAKTISDGPVPLSVALGGFGVALGLPFALFAMFPSWLNNLPKSGGWLNSVKVVLGFAEVALAVKFLSNADLVKQWHIVHRETFFLIWGIIAVLTGIYLLGKIKFPHDSPIKKLKTSRVVLALAFIGFGIYLLPGILPKPPWEHKLVAGFPPPTFYSWYNTDEGDEGDHKVKCPLNLDCTKDFDEARDRADLSQKPIFIDFTGWACVNCRRMEENVWIDEDVYDKLSKEFEVVSLYVDDKRDLAEDKKGVVEIVYEDGETKLKAINTIGDRWTALEILSFENATQPLYAVISPDGTLMSSPVGYTPDSGEYNAWLQCSLDAYEAYQAEN
jgi:thiol:disulfide interchange protein DsbD